MFLEKAKLGLDPKLFKKLTDEIWEFRTLYSGKNYRFFDFWDKTDKSETLVTSTHGIIKKVSKIPKAEIEKSMQNKSGIFYTERLLNGNRKSKNENYDA